MSESRHCPQCHSKIPAHSPAGLCPRCLLRGVGSNSLAFEQPEPTRRTPPGPGFVPPTVEELAKCLPHLQILELLGKGGMGAVYKARQPGLDRFVAVKILRPEISHDPNFAERFQREARAMARLNHPHIVAVYDFGQTPHRSTSTQPNSESHPEAGPEADSPRQTLFYIVMEFVDGANLRQAIQGGKLTAEEALAIVPQICEALQFAHDEGIVHRDIKPENILIDKRGRVRIADFGLAKLLGTDAAGESLTGTHQVMGTLRYMAPEQMQGTKIVDHRADIYSLGVVFYELLTGELPMGRFAPPSRKVQIDVRLDEVVLRALDQDPEQRYQHASDVKLEVESIARHRDVLRPGDQRSLPPVSGVRGAGPVSQFSSLQGSNPAIEPRLSRLAISGAIWAPLFFVMVLASMIAVTVPEGRPPELAWWQLLLSFTLLPMGVAAPFGTTILGAVAIAKIKRSAGRLYGLRLAIADAFLFPLLTLFLAIAGSITASLISMFSVVIMVAALPAVTVASVVCFFVARAAIRAVYRSEKTDNAPLQRTSKSDPPAKIRPRFISVFATINLLVALVLMTVCAGVDPLPLPDSTPGIWRIWGQISRVLGFLMAAGLFASSVGLYLRQEWSRRVLLGVCIFGLASLVIDMPYLAQAEIPNIVADMRAFLATEGRSPEEQEFWAPVMCAGLFVALLSVSLPLLIGQLVYFSKSSVMAAFKE